MSTTPAEQPQPSRDLTQRAGFGMSRWSFARGLTGFGLAKLLPGIIGLVTVPLWLRVFGESPYGGYTIFWVAVNFGSALALGWLRQSLLRYSGVTGLSRRSLPRWTIAACVTAAALPMPFLAIGAGSGDASTSGALLVAALAFSAVNSIYLIDQALAQRDRRVGAFTAAETARAAGALAASLVLGVWFGVEAVSAMVGGYALSTAVAIPILRYKRRSQASGGAHAPDIPPKLAALWSYGWPMSIWLALAQVLVYFDRLVLPLFISPAELGAYAAVSDLVVRGIAMAVFPITMLAHPVIMQRWNSGDREGALRINRHYLLLVVGVAAVCVLALALVGQYLLTLLLDTALPPLGTIVALAVGASLWQVAMQSHKGLEMQGRTKLMTSLLAAICLVTFVSLFFVVPAYGTFGSALVFALGAGVYVVLTLWLSSASMKGKNFERSA